MHKAKSMIIDLMLLFIITVPAFSRILNSQYFSMHDDQHIVRLFLLDQGIRQGYLYPRWVDGLGFGFGYALFNFYPPLTYYVGEFFHLIGFSLIWSIKLVFVLGFYLGAYGIYLLAKIYTNRLAGFLSATLYTYFFYHAVLIYVRGALAEFFSLAILPFVFLALENFADKTNWKSGIIFGVSFALLILCHPLIALPSIIFIGFYFIYYLWKRKSRFHFLSIFITSLFLGLGLSAFFWLPSMFERKYTLTDQILTGELASYKLHYIYPQQFYYSPWGYGGSGPGLSDGVTFQLGKIHIGLAILSIFLYFIFSVKNKKNDLTINYYLLTIFLLIFSLFMTTSYSSFIWDSVNYLWYLQFPWRFLTFTTIFISIVGGLSFFIFVDLTSKIISRNKLFRLLIRYLSLPRCYALLGGLICIFTIFTYQKYFKPQRYIQTTDNQRTTFDEVSWRISRTSYEFVPKDVKTKKTELNTTVIDIDKNDLPKKSYEILSGQAYIDTIENNFAHKKFIVNAQTPIAFRLNTYNFPNWSAYLNDKALQISDQNNLKLITLNIPEGSHILKFTFENTTVRKTANLISVTSLVFVSLLFWKKFKKVDG